MPGRKDDERDYEDQVYRRDKFSRENDPEIEIERRSPTSEPDEDSSSREE